MKKLLLLTTFLLIVICASAQESKVLLIKATSVATRWFDKSTQTWKEWSEWQECDLIIRIDMEKYSIHIPNKWDDAFKILEVIQETSGTDPNDSDNYKETFFSAIDKEGVKCHISMRTYDSGTKQIYCLYKNCSYGYQGRIIEF
jgi:hypothetical protein